MIYPKIFTETVSKLFTLSKDHGGGHPVPWCFFKCVLFLHIIAVTMSSHLPDQVSLSESESTDVVSGLELAVAADGDLRGGGSRSSSALVLRAAVAGLRAARVARGGRQHVGVMAAVLEGAVR